MLLETFMTDFTPYTMIFTVFLSLTLWYYKFIFKPYGQFPSCRLEYKIVYWTLTGRKINFEIMQFLTEQAKKYQTEGVFVLWIGKPIFVVYGEDIVKNIVNEPSSTDKPTHYKLMEFAYSKGILTSKGEDYKKQRKIVSPAFHATAVKSYAAIMNKNAEALVKRLLSTKGRTIENIIDILSECTANVLFETNFGEETTVEDNKLLIAESEHVTKLFVTRFISPWLYFDFCLNLFPSARKTCRLVKDMRERIIKPRLEIIKASLISRRDSPNKEEEALEFCGKKPKSFAEAFVEQHLQDQTISIEEIASQLLFIVGAGFDTVVHSMKFTLFLLGLHQDVQDRAREEVTTKTEGNITAEDQQSLIYLESVIKESLRLFPVPFFGRYLQKELQNGKYKIPRNSNVALFPYMLHRNPEIFSNPEKFDPERFINEKSKIKPWQFIPFAEGLRQCTGKYYALFQMKILLAHILRNFKIISLDQRDDITLQWSIVLECTRELRMQFVPIKQSIDTNQNS